ncbi:cytochrome p450 domain-containing protein [Ditylenchus destructor]|nr:cytochrome p450 domain-containing protein [Ditylenchus destructor]
MFIFWILILLCIIIAILRYFFNLQNYWSTKGIPGPNGAFMFGHFFQLRLSDKQTILQLQKWTEEFGKFYGIMDGTRKVLVISDLALVHELLTTKFDIFEARKLNPLADELSEFNAGSILHATSFRWRRLRSIAATYFNSSKVRKAIPTLERITTRSLEFLHEHCRDGKPIDIQPYLQKLTDDTIMHMIFGDGTQKERFFDEMFRALRAKKRPIERIFSIVAAIFTWSRSTINSVNVTLRNTNSYFNVCLFNSIAEYVKERRKSTTTNSNDSSFKSYLDHLLESSVHPCGENLHTDGSDDGSECNNLEQKVSRYLMENEIVSACMNFLYAGHKTSARALIAVVQCLALNLDVQKKALEEEIRDIEEKLTFEKIERLTYLDCIIREALRLYPLGSEHVARKCTTSTTLGPNIPIESGTYVMVDVMSLHSNPSLWGKDPEKFNPSRWLDDPNRNAYFSFGQGPRMCLGEKLAIVQLKVMLVILLRNFTFVADNSTHGPTAELLHQKLIVNIRSNSEEHAAKQQKKGLLMTSPPDKGKYRARVRLLQMIRRLSKLEVAIYREELIYPTARMSAEIARNARDTMKCFTNFSIEKLLRESKTTIGTSVDMNDNFQETRPKSDIRMRKRCSFSALQVHFLEVEFTKNRYISSEQRQWLSIFLGLTPQQVRLSTEEIKNR